MLKSWLGSIKAWQSDESGQSIIIVAALAVALCAFAGFVIDYGRAASDRGMAQNAADSAALGAAYSIYAGATTESTATAKAQQLVQTYGYSASDMVGTPTYLDVNGTPTTDASSVNSVVVQLSDSLDAIPLLKLVGISTLSVSAASGAIMQSGASGSCALCLMNTGQDITNSGSGTVSVPNANIEMSTASGHCSTTSGSVSITAQAITAPGGSPCVSFSGTYPFHPTVSTGAAPADPLINLKEPNDPSAPLADQCGASKSAPVESGNGWVMNLIPGSYGSIITSGSGTINLAAGLYCFSSSLSFSGSVTLNGTGVTLFFSGSAGLLDSGSGQFNISAPTSGDYQGLAIFYDRNDAAGFVMSGNASSEVKGTIYARAAQWKTSGSGQTFDSTMIIGSMIVSGSTGVNVNDTLTDQFSVGKIPVLNR